MTNILDIFENWVEISNRNLVPRITIREKEDEFLWFGFEGISSCIQAALGSIGIDVFVVVDDCGWDIIMSFDCVTETTPDGFVCGFCVEEARVAYSSVAELWEQHVFRRLEHWIMTDLAAANYIGLGGEKEHATWATLLTSDLKDYTTILPVRVDIS